MKHFTSCEATHTANAKEPGRIRPRDSVLSEEAGGVRFLELSLLTLTRGHGLIILSLPLHVVSALNPFARTAYD